MGRAPRLAERLLHSASLCLESPHNPARPSERASRLAAKKRISNFKTGPTDHAGDVRMPCGAAVPKSIRRVPLARAVLHAATPSGLLRDAAHHQLLAAAHHIAGAAKIGTMTLCSLSSSWFAFSSQRRDPRVSRRYSAARSPVPSRSLRAGGRTAYQSNFRARFCWAARDSRGRGWPGPGIPVSSAIANEVRGARPS